MKPPTLFVIGLLVVSLSLTVDTYQSPSLDLTTNTLRGKVEQFVPRSRRQAEDSYEDGEYEYEEGDGEEEQPSNGHEEEQETNQPGRGKEAQQGSDEDFENYDENTKTSPSPPTEIPEELNPGVSTENSNPSLKKNVGDVETAEVEQQQIHSVESTPETERDDDDTDRRQSESHESSAEDPEEEEREREEEQEEIERESEYENAKQLERELEREREAESTRVTESERKTDEREQSKSVEIQETGRDDLERYTNNNVQETEEPGYSSASHENSYQEQVSEEDEITPTTVVTTITTSTTTPLPKSVSSVSEEFEIGEEEEDEEEEEGDHHVDDHEEEKQKSIDSNKQIIEVLDVSSTSKPSIDDEEEEEVQEEENTTQPPPLHSSSQEEDNIDENLREGEEEGEDEEEEAEQVVTTTIPPTSSHPNMNEIESGSLEEQHENVDERKDTEKLSIDRDPLESQTKDIADNTQEEDEEEEDQESEQVHEDRSNELQTDLTPTSQQENQVDVNRNQIVGSSSSSQEIYTTSSSSSPPPVYTTSILGTLPSEIDSSENHIIQEKEKSHQYSNSEQDSILSSEDEEYFSSTTTTTLAPEISIEQDINSLEDEEEELESQEISTDEVPTKETRPKIECYSGYQLSPDGTECLDIDECVKGFCGPNQICTNLLGSFQCSCPTGFQKDFRNEKNCRDINECEENNGGCAQDCINTQGSFYCTCSDDFILEQDGRLCNLKPTTTTTTTTTTAPPTIPTTTTTTTASTTSTTSPIPTLGITTLSGQDEIRHNKYGCNTPPVPRGGGIAYLYCSRSPVGIHHRHSQLERRLLQDWAVRRNKTAQESRNNNLRFRHRRNLKRRLRQTNYSPGSMCELRCRPGFQLIGQYTLHCNASNGTWQGTTTGYCQALPKNDNKNITIGNSINSEATSNEIPTLPPNEINGFRYDRRRPSASSSQFPTILTSPKPITTTTTRLPNTTDRPVKTTTTSVVRPIPAYTFVPTRATSSWAQPPLYHTFPTTRRPSNRYSPTFQSITTSATPTTTTTTSRNSFIQLTYRYKTPWIKCPDDIKIDLPPNQNLAYVIIPQPLTNVDWFRQVLSIPTWAKGLESEVGPGKQRITFRARTSAPTNNTAECSLTLEVRDTEPPRVRECPESFTTRLNPGQNAKAVAWTEPHFSDNVRISSLKKSHEPGTIMTVGEHLINYDAKDPSDNTAKCSFTITLLPAAASSPSIYRKPLNTEDDSTTSGPSKPADVHTTMRNVVCYVGKKGRRIIFQSRVVPRGCSEMTVDVVGDSNQDRSVDTLNTVSQNSVENSATSQISSVSFSTHENPKTASAFSQSVSNGRNNNRLVHSTSSVSNSAHGTTSRASSYAIAVSSSSRNFDLPFLSQDKQGAYEEDFVVPSVVSVPKTRSGQGRGNNNNNRDRLLTRTNAYHQHSPHQRRPNYIQAPQQEIEIPDMTSTRENFLENNNNDHRNSNSSRNKTPERVDEPRKFFRHFDSWDRERKRDLDSKRD